MSAKDVIKNLPGVGPLAVRAVRQVKARRAEPFDTSGSYWERRYDTGGNSGAGSYRRLAQFKADVLNEFVRKHEVRSVLELGCGDGAQLALADYPAYLGCDVSRTAVEMCRTRFAGDGSKEFMLLGELPADRSADLTLSLDVIFHLVEDDVFAEHMRALFDHAERFVVIYASNEDRDGPAAHVRHRRFTDWVERQRPEWRLRSTVPNAYPADPADPDETSFADFYMYGR